MAAQAQPGRLREGRVRRGRGGALRQPRARVRAPGVPEQDRARDDQRRRRQAAARADAGVLRLLRLALVGARALAAGAPRAAVPGCAVRRRAPAPRSREASRRRTSRPRSRYLAGPGRTSFERPYGLAWLLQLAAELREWKDPQAQQWAAALGPLETAAAARLKEWLPKLSRPDPDRRARPDRVRVRPRARLGAHGRRSADDRPDLSRRSRSSTATTGRAR